MIMFSRVLFFFHFFFFTIDEGNSIDLESFNFIIYNRRMFIVISMVCGARCRGRRQVDDSEMIRGEVSVRCF